MIVGQGKETIQLKDKIAAGQNLKDNILKKC